MMSKQPVKILLVEDCRADVELIRQALSESKGEFEVYWETSLAASLHKLSGEEFAIVLLDLGLPDSKGLSGVAQIHSLHPEIPIVVLTGSASDDMAMAALAHGAQDYLKKEHATCEVLTRSIRYAIQRQQNIAIRQLLAQVRESQKELEAKNQQLVASEERFRLMVEGVHDYAIFMLDPTGHVVNWNVGARRIYGYAASEIIGRHYSIFCLAEDVATGAADDSLVVAAVKGQAGEECLRVRKDGSKFWANTVTTAVRNAKGQIIGYCRVTRDLTEIKQAEEALRERDSQLRQSQKLEAVGELAGGVAHEFNNLLQAILGYTNFALEGLSPDNQRRQDLEQVVIAALRATDLTQGMLSFSRRQPIKSQPIDPNGAVADLLKMLRPLIGEHIELAVTLGEDVSSINADATLIQQMLMNLCLNARDAMPSGGQLIIKTENLVLSDFYCERHADVKPGHYVLISVADTGCGMSPEVKQHIFEPFFTTKDVGEGTGLGLAMVYGVIKQHRGAIHVYSEPGHGTTIKVYLPIANALSSQDRNKNDQLIHGGTETILIAEDEPMVRDLAVRILGQAGYTTLTAADGDEAIRVYEANADRIDLALLDVVMPKRFGREVYQAIRMLNPKTKVVFCSGYEPDTNCEGFVTKEDLQLIQKPFDRDVLLRTVREVLDEEASCLMPQLAP